jgi:hypothetical protein
MYSLKQRPEHFVSKHKRTLEDIKQLIQEHYQLQKEAIRQSLIHAKIMGDLLLEAKGQLKHGQWSNWLKDHFPDFADTTVRNYMRISEHWEQLQESAMIADLTMVKALKILSKYRKAAKSMRTYAAPTEDFLVILNDLELKFKHFQTIPWQSAVSERIPPLLDKLTSIERQLKILKDKISRCFP